MTNDDLLHDKYDRNFTCQNICHFVARSLNLLLLILGQGFFCKQISMILKSLENKSEKSFSHISAKNMTIDLKGMWDLTTISRAESN